MFLSFTLSMAGVSSWNGKWSGGGKLYVRVFNYGRSEEARKKAQGILDIGCFYYSFGDGWSAKVTVNKINAKEAVKMRKKSSGFCGYDWMIESIKSKLKIEP